MSRSRVKQSHAEGYWRRLENKVKIGESKVESSILLLLDKRRE